MSRKLAAVVFMIIVGFVPVLVAAQENQQPADDTASEVATTTDDGERVFEDRIVVTASRREELSGNAPAPISVIDAQMIEQFQPEKMVDLFKQIPGVEIQGEGPFRGIPNIRGLSSNRVLILVDGQRLNNARESTTFAGIQPGLSNLSSVETIEVLRGPASVQYGSDAIGGVINIITRRPNLGQEDFTVDGTVGYTYGTSSESNDANFQVTGTGEKFGFTVGGAYQDADNYTAADGANEDERFEQYVDEDNRVYNSGAEQSAFNTNLRFATGDQGVFAVNTEVVRTQDIGFPGFDPVESGININFPNFDRDKFGLAWNSGPMWGLDDFGVSAYYQTVYKESIRNFDFLPWFGSFSDTTSEIDSFGFNVQGIANVGVNHLTFGLDTYRDTLDDTAFSELCDIPFAKCKESTAVAVPDSRQTGIGVYIQDEISISSAVTLLAGLRGDSFDFKSEDDPDYDGAPIDTTDSDISGNVGVVWGVTDHVNVSAIIARGFRSPNLQERALTGLATTGDTILLQNPDLSSERSLNYEVGFKARYSRYSGGLHVYYNDLTDFITFDIFDPADGDLPEECPDKVITGLDCGQLENTGKAKIWGIEFEFETIFASWWSMFINSAYSEGDNKTTSEPLNFIPPFKVVLGVQYQRASWFAEASARMLADQNRVPDDVDPSNSFTSFDLRAGYDFAFGLGVLAAFENITDELYAEPFNNRPEPGRNLRVSLRYKF